MKKLARLDSNKSGNSNPRLARLARLIGFSSSVGIALSRVGSIFAQSPSAAPATGGGATSGALPSAGTTELTYILFLGGVILFVFGTIKLLLSFRD
ncbi:hypothetical protein HYU92_00855 [Candidatus Curtissbacteria bacterium]|nr:hypothetical protein [Candidatus Curtissbacteria bacterium]